MARRPGVTGQRGIRRQPHRRYGAEIWEPVIRRRVWLGTFNSIRDAALAHSSAFSRFYGPNMAPTFSLFRNNYRNTSTNMVDFDMARRPGVTGQCGIRRQPHGRYGAEVWDPVIRRQVWLGTFNSIRDAALAYSTTISRFYGLNMAPTFSLFINNYRNTSTNMVQSPTSMAPLPIRHPPPPSQQRSGPILPNRDRFDFYALPPNVRQCLVAEIAMRTQGVNRFQVSGNTSSIVVEPPQQPIRTPRVLDLNLPPPDDA